MERRLNLTATLTTAGTVTPPIGPVPPDTAAALEAAIRTFGVCAYSPSEPSDPYGIAGAHIWIEIEDYAAPLKAAITAHVEAEVARRLAAAPDVEVSIVDYALAAQGDFDTSEERDALRAAIAADKARAVEAARISIGTVSDLGDIVACRIAALGEPRWRRYLAKRSEMAVGS